jgi:hypothetical protein
METSDLRLIPGEGIGPYRIGQSIRELRLMLDGEYREIALPAHRVVDMRPYQFWIDRKYDRVFQILVGPGFDGKFLDRVGVGSTLADVREIAGEYICDAEVYLLPRYPGICFELAEAVDEDESTSPIEFISIYNLE